jgi:hypothetical protein
MDYTKELITTYPPATAHSQHSNIRLKLDKTSEEAELYGPKEAAAPAYDN